MLLRDALREVEYSPAFQDAYKQLWYEACREAQLARAVVEAAEAEKGRRTGGMGMLADYEDNTADALAAYRAEFPQPNPVKTHGVTPDVPVVDRLGRPYP